MSSTEFSVRITPVDRIRNRIKLGAAGLAAWGGLVLLHLPFPAAIRGALAVAWLGWCLFELYRYSRAAARIRRIVVMRTGRLIIIGPRGRRASARLLPGTTITSTMAWLRFRLSDGTNFGEFLCANAVQTDDWHRLQLIWRQGRPFIGSLK